jgi:hypothetical protein
MQPAQQLESFGDDYYHTSIVVVAPAVAVISILTRRTIEIRIIKSTLLALLALLALTSILGRVDDDVFE